MEADGLELHHPATLVENGPSWLIDLATVVKEDPGASWISKWRSFFHLTFESGDRKNLLSAGAGTERDGLAL